MVTNERGKVLCIHTATGKSNYFDPSFVKNETLLKSRGWEVANEPQAPPVKVSIANPEVKNKTVTNPVLNDTDAERVFEPLQEVTDENKSKQKTSVSVKPKRAYRKRTTSKK